MGWKEESETPNKGGEVSLHAPRRSKEDAMSRAGAVEEVVELGGKGQVSHYAHGPKGGNWDERVSIVMSFVSQRWTESFV